MKISGLQKMTLLDYPGKIACTVFLSGCNFRCPFCHNGELLGADAETLMDEAQLLTFLSKRKGLLDAVCISGGEPTLQAGLEELLRKIRELGYLTKLDTNGSRPEVLKQLVGAGLLDYVAMDIKNSPQRYAETAGAQVQLDKIEKSVRFLMEDYVDYEFRTTVVEQLHDEASVSAMGQWVKNLGNGAMAKRWFVQPFVDRDTVLFAGLEKPDDTKLASFVEILKQYAVVSELRG